jgi:hypothetical protein
MQMELAYRMQSHAREAVDFGREPTYVKRWYGLVVPVSSHSLLRS